ncbi:MAG: MBL fold metallo-hydrolase, partial [Pseudomonadota bacterium]
MKVTFCGAAKIVTGSCFLVETGEDRVLVDCGMFQGIKDIVKLNFEPFRFEPRGVAHVLLTHSHIDHSGLIPKLVKMGFDGKILATGATADLCKIMLEDSARIQVLDTESENRRRKREGLEPRAPLYTLDHAEEAFTRFDSVEYDERRRIAPNIEVCFRDAGHILGSSIIEMFVKEGGKDIKLVFSGDLGQWDAPIVRDPTIIEDADYVFIESTYGDRLHEDAANRGEHLMKHVKETYKKGGRLLIPSFAVERTQELIFAFNKLIRSGGFPEEKIYLDSPLAIKATEVFKKHRECFDEEALTLFEQPLTYPRLVYTLSTEDSMKLNTIDEPCVIIAGSGMCNGGRIRHHFKHGLWDSKNTVLFVGYQARGTLGRVLLDGAAQVKMMGMNIVVKASIQKIDSYSAHADYEELIRWAKGFSKKPGK